MWQAHLFCGGWLCMHIQVEGCCLVVVRDDVGGADQVGVVVGLVADRVGAVVSLVVDHVGAVVGLDGMVWMLLVGQVTDLARLIIGLDGQVMHLVDLVVDL